MKIRALVLSSLRIAAFGGLAAACGGSQGKVPVDTPILKYKQPDIDDITGADDDMDSDTDSDTAGSAAGSGSAAATPATPAPATPRK